MQTIGSRNIVSVKPKHSIRVYPCPSVAQSQTSKADRTPETKAIWPRMDTDTHGCGALASSRSTGRRLEQNYMVMFWQNAILVPRGSLAFKRPAVRAASSSQSLAKSLTQPGRQSHARPHATMKFP